MESLNDADRQSACAQKLRTILEKEIMNLLFNCGRTPQLQNDVIAEAVRTSHFRGQLFFARRLGKLLEVGTDNAPADFGDSEGPLT